MALCRPPAHCPNTRPWPPSSAPPWASETSLAPGAAPPSVRRRRYRRRAVHRQAGPRGGWWAGCSASLWSKEKTREHGDSRVTGEHEECKWNFDSIEFLHRQISQREKLLSNRKNYWELSNYLKTRRTLCKFKESDPTHKLLPKSWGEE